MWIDRHCQLLCADADNITKTSKLDVPLLLKLEGTPTLIVMRSLSALIGVSGCVQTRHQSPRGACPEARRTHHCQVSSIHSFLPHECQNSLIRDCCVRLQDQNASTTATLCIYRHSMQSCVLSCDVYYLLESHSPEE